MTFIRFFNEIKRSYSKCCVDCKYYLTTNFTTETDLKNINYFATAKCRKFLSEKADGMGPEYEYAYITRSEKSMCGPQGTHFKPLIKKD